MQVLYLLRHGETDFNRDGRVQGFTESSLSDLGREQATRLGKRIQSVQIHKTFTSPLVRAVETCELALGEGNAYETRDGLKEINLGEWEGKSAAELRKTHPEQVKKWFHSPSEVSIKGAETIAQFRSRVTAEMDAIRESCPDRTLAVFAHGGVICTYLTSLLDMALDDIWRFKIRNASVTRIIFPQDRARIDLLGDVHHLDGAMRQPPHHSHRVFP